MASDRASGSDKRSESAWVRVSVSAWVRASASASVLVSRSSIRRRRRGHTRRSRGRPCRRSRSRREPASSDEGSRPAEASGSARAGGGRRVGDDRRRGLGTRGRGLRLIGGACRRLGRRGLDFAGRCRCRRPSDRRETLLGLAGRAVRPEDDSHESDRREGQERDAQFAHEALARGARGWTRRAGRGPHACRRLCCGRACGCRRRRCAGRRHCASHHWSAPSRPASCFRSSGRHAPTAPIR